MGINSKHFGHSWVHFLPSQAGHSPSSGHTHLPWPGRLWTSSHLKLFCCCISPTFSYTLALSSLILKWNQDLESHLSHLRPKKKKKINAIIHTTKFRDNLFYLIYFQRKAQDNRADSGETQPHLRSLKMRQNSSKVRAGLNLLWTRWGWGAGGERALIPTRLVR